MVHLLLLPRRLSLPDRARGRMNVGKSTNSHYLTLTHVYSCAAAAARAVAWFRFTSTTKLCFVGGLAVTRLRDLGAYGRTGLALTGRHTGTSLTRQRRASGFTRLHRRRRFRDHVHDELLN